MKVSTRAYACVEKALRQYVAEVNASRLAPSTKETYINGADQFVRWLRDDFTPGEYVDA